MNILYVDIDSLRPDHLGCYGYHRPTSPNLDALAAEGLRFTRCYTPDAPCLPSRTAMTTGRFGIHTGVVNHGGVASQPFIWGADRAFGCNMTDGNWANVLRASGYHTVAFSPFAQRHGAWHWYAGFLEMHNTGHGGQETAEMIAPQVTGWLDHHGKDEKPFFMWVNVWDPHTPYRTPASHGNPFKEDPIPEWYTESVRADHWNKPGPHSAQEVNEFEPAPDWLFGPESLKNHPRLAELQPTAISDLNEARRMFDGYDMGVHYADLHVGKIIQHLKDLGLYENTAIIVSSDHGENLGELNIYGDHQTADQFTTNVPMIMRWPGVTDARAGQADSRRVYSIDVAATTLELAGCHVPKLWDGRGFSESLNRPDSEHRAALVVSQLAWCAQRAALWEDWILIETYHDGYHDYPKHMLFNLADDPHEQDNLAESQPELVRLGLAILEDWHEDAMRTATHPQDPLETVMAEGGPYHVRGDRSKYLARLRATGRGDAADRLALKHPCVS